MMMMMELWLLVNADIRGEDSGLFGCVLQGDVDIVNAAYINVHVRGQH